MKTLLLLIAFLVLTACSPAEETPPPDPKVETQASVPEDNVFHDQVAALEKAKDVAKQQEEHAQQMDAAIEQATGDGDESSN